MLTLLRAVALAVIVWAIIGTVVGIGWVVYEMAGEAFLIFFVMFACTVGTVAMIITIDD